MMNSKRTNFHLWQAQAFMDYSSKFGIRDKAGLLPIFKHWVESKEFLAKDAKHIQKLVEQFWKEKEKKMAEKRKKCCSNDKVEEPIRTQFEFPFVSGLDKIAKKQEDVESSKRKRPPKRKRRRPPRYKSEVSRGSDDARQTGFGF